MVVVTVVVIFFSLPSVVLGSSGVDLTVVVLTIDSSPITFFSSPSSSPVFFSSSPAIFSSPVLPPSSPLGGREVRGEATARSSSPISPEVVVLVVLAGDES